MTSGQLIILMSAEWSKLITSKCIFSPILGAFFDKTYHNGQNDSNLHIGCQLPISKIHLITYSLQMGGTTTSIIMPIIKQSLKWSREGHMVYLNPTHGPMN